MVWTIDYSKQALKALKKMDKQAARRIVDYLTVRVAPLEDPRTLGKALKGELGEYWRYRVGDYRILCEIKEGKLEILAATIGHRKHVYENF